MYIYTHNYIITYYYLWKMYIYILLQIILAEMCRRLQLQDGRIAIQHHGHHLRENPGEPGRTRTGKAEVCIVIMLKYVYIYI